MLHVSVVLIIPDIKYMIFQTQNKMNMDFKLVKLQIKSSVYFILSF